MDAFPGIISVVVFVAVVISSSISLRLLGKEPVASNTNISTWILNCALANYLHCLFILPIGIGFHSLGLQDLHIVEDIWMELETPFSLQFHSVAFLFVIFSEHMKIRTTFEDKGPCSRVSECVCDLSMFYVPANHNQSY